MRGNGRISWYARSLLHARGVSDLDFNLGIDPALRFRHDESGRFGAAPGEDDARKDQDYRYLDLGREVQVARTI